MKTKKYKIWLHRECMTFGETNKINVDFKPENTPIV